MKAIKHQVTRIDSIKKNVFNRLRHTPAMPHLEQNQAEADYLKYYRQATRWKWDD